MTNIAELGIRIDTTDTARAVTELDKLTAAGGNAEKSTTSLMSEIAALEKSLAAGAKSASELGKQREQLAKLTKAGAYNEAEFAKVTKQLDKDQIALVKSTMDEQKALNSLLGAIDPAAASAAKLDRQVQELGKHLDAGRISQEQYNSALAKLDGKDANLGKVAAGFGKINLSSRQTQENIMQVANGLSSGDWGNAVRGVTQLGVGAGASAAGFLSLVAPIGLVVGGLGALAAAYLSGQKEEENFNKSLILTGNYAGTSASQLGDMAANIGSTIGTTGQAAEALATLAGTGKIAGDSLDEIAVAAISMQQATGKAVQDTIAEFVKLADDPVKASAALNEQYHFLTASVYAQIVALEEQGDHVGAVKLATDTYADTVKNRAGQITENLGLIERGWLAVKNATLGALDAAKNVGREGSTNDLIEQTKKQLEFLQNNPGLEVSVPGQRGAVSGSAGLQTLKDQLVFLQDQKAAEAEIAKLDEQQAKAQQDSVIAMTKVDALTKSSYTNEQKRAEAIKDYKKDLEDIRKTNPTDPRLAQTAIDKNIANINAKYKDPKGAKTRNSVDLTGVNDTKNGLEEILATYKNADKELQATQRAGLISQESYLNQRTALLEQEKAEVTNSYEAQIAALEAAKNKAGTTAEQRIQLDQKIADARTDMVKAQQSADSELSLLAINEEGRLRKQAQAVDTYTDALNKQVTTLRQQGMRAAAGVGQGSRRGQLADQQNAIDDRVNSQKIDLANQFGDGSRGMSLDEYNAKLKALENTQNDLHDTVIANYDDMSKAQSSWANGASAAFEDFSESAQDIASQTYDLVGGTLDDLTTGLSDGLAEAIVNGENLRDTLDNVANSIATNVLGSLIKMGSQYAVNAALEMAGITAVTGAKTAAAATVASAEVGAIATTTAAASAATATTTTEQVAAAGTTASSWSLAAIAASIGSFGSAAAIGLAAVVAALAFGKGFKSGGYTGGGGRNDIAGVTHGQEFVMNAEATSRIGVGTLEAMQRGDAVSLRTPSVAGQAAATAASSAPASVSYITVNQPNVTNAKEAKQSAQQTRKQLGRAINGTRRAD